MDAGDEEDQDINHLAMISPEEEEAVKTKSPSSTLQHYLSSAGATLTIRQLPSEGLSFQLWPAATTLVTLLDTHRHSGSPLGPIFPISRQLRVLELGSGTGLVGIAAAVTLGAKVTVTDLPHVIPNLQHNVERNAEVVKLNGGVVGTAALRWGKVEDVATLGGEYDVVLASDVVYHDHLYGPLIETLRLLLLGERRDVVMLMSHLRRWKKESAFFKRAKKSFHVHTIHTDRPCEGSRTGVVVYRFVARSSKCNS